MTEPKVIKLQYPIEYGESHITELRFPRRLKARDLKGLSATPGFDELLTLVGRLSGQPPSVIDELDGADLEAAVGVVTDFLPGGRGTGESG